MQTRAFAALAPALATVLLALGAHAGEKELEAAVVRLAEHARARTPVIYGAIGLGSGAVVAKDGTTVTNAHVVIGARIAVLEFADGRRVVARRKGIDLERDLAILVPEEPLEEPAPFFELGPDARPAVGTWLVGVGFPGGPRGDKEPTVSLGRATEGGGMAGPAMGVLRYDQAIRTDLAIFSGNSGGPLLDLEGRLVGINGAIDASTGAAFSVPVETVKDRLATLENGAIRFPGGRTLDRKNPLVAALDRALEPLARRLSDQIARGFEGPALEEALDRLRPEEPGPERDALAKLLRNQGRSRSIAERIRAERSVAVRLGDRLATRVGRKHLVAKASLLGERREFPVGRRTARLVATAEEHDLALLELDEEDDVRLPEDAGARAPGTFVGVLGPDGVLAGGIVSVKPRAIPRSVSLRISAGGLPPQVRDALRSLEQLAKRLGSKELEDLVASVKKSLELREAINLGNEPRGYARVLSHDAGLAPSEAGAPLVDAQGRLVGVNVANANYGTSYAVPIATVREAFAKHLGPARPERIGKAKLY